TPAPNGLTKEIRPSCLSHEGGAGSGRAITPWARPGTWCDERSHAGGRLPRTALQGATLVTFDLVTLTLAVAAAVVLVVFLSSIYMPNTLVVGGNGWHAGRRTGPADAPDRRRARSRTTLAERAGMGLMQVVSDGP